MADPYTFEKDCPINEQSEAYRAVSLYTNLDIWLEMSIKERAAFAKYLIENVSKFDMNIVPLLWRDLAANPEGYEEYRLDRLPPTESGIISNDPADKVDTRPTKDSEDELLS